jgi:hypothetical protein
MKINGSVVPSVADMISAVNLTYLDDSQLGVNATFVSLIVSFVLSIEVIVFAWSTKKYKLAVLDKIRKIKIAKIRPK